MGTTVLEFAIYTSVFIKKHNNDGYLQYGYFRANVFHIFSAVVAVMSDYIMASMYFISAVGLYTTKYHKHLIVLFVLVACFFLGFSFYGLFLNLRGVSSQEKTF